MMRLLSLKVVIRKMGRWGQILDIFREMESRRSKPLDIKPGIKKSLECGI